MGLILENGVVTMEVADQAWQQAQAQALARTMCIRRSARSRASCTPHSTSWALPTRCAAAWAKLPDAQSRLSYIARLTGEAAEKVLGRVEQAKAQHDYIASETRRMVTSLVAGPGGRRGPGDHQLSDRRGRA